MIKLSKDSSMKVNISQIIVILAALACPWLAVGDVVLVKDGKACAEIVLPKDAWDVEKYAAEEFVHFLKKSTGAELPVVRMGDEKQSAAKVLIGRAAALDSLPQWKGRVVSTDGVLKIAGGDDKSFSRSLTGVPAEPCMPYMNFLTVS